MTELRSRAASNGLQRDGRGRLLKEIWVMTVLPSVAYRFLPKSKVAAIDLKRQFC